MRRRRRIEYMDVIAIATIRASAIVAVSMSGYDLMNAPIWCQTPVRAASA